VEAATASVELSKCCERDLGFGRAAEGDPGCDMGGDTDQKVILTVGRL